MLKFLETYFFRLRQNSQLIAFHFLHSTTGILLLLFVGQAVSHGDSTKSKLLKIILPFQLHMESLWYWIGGVILLKFFSTFLMNYLYQITIHNTQADLRKQLVSNPFLKSISLSEFDLNHISKSFVKGILYLCSDLLLLGLIFWILTMMNGLVAQCWLLFILFGLILRFLVVRYSVNAKTELKKAINSAQRKWKWIMLQRGQLLVDGQWEKDLRVLRIREKKARSASRKYSFHHAWTAGFFPVYFFLFLFSVVWIFQTKGIKDDGLLIILLLIIYSQSAIMRLFKTPTHWRILGDFQQSLSMVEVSKNVGDAVRTKPSSEVLLRFSAEAIRDFSDLDWKKLYTELFPPTFPIDPDQAWVYQQICVLNFQQPILGETYLSAIVTGRESEQFVMIQEWMTRINSDELAQIPWTDTPDFSQLNERQKQWMQLFKVLLHPGHVILVVPSATETIKTEHFNIFLILAQEQNKTIISINEASNH